MLYALTPSVFRPHANAPSWSVDPMLYAKIPLVFGTSCKCPHGLWTSCTTPRSLDRLRMFPLQHLIFFGQRDPLHFCFVISDVIYVWSLDLILIYPFYLSWSSNLSFCLVIWPFILFGLPTFYFVLLMVFRTPACAPRSTGPHAYTQ